MARLAMFRSRVGGLLFENRRDPGPNREIQTHRRRESMDANSMLSFRLFLRNKSSEDIPPRDGTSSWVAASAVAETPLDTYQHQPTTLPPTQSDDDSQDVATPTAQAFHDKTATEASPDTAPAPAPETEQEAPKITQEPENVTPSVPTITTDAPSDTAEMNNTGLTDTPSIADLPARYRGSIYNMSAYGECQNMPNMGSDGDPDRSGDTQILYEAPEEQDETRETLETTNAGMVPIAGKPGDTNESTIEPPMCGSEAVHSPVNSPPKAHSPTQMQLPKPSDSPQTPVGTSLLLSPDSNAESPSSDVQRSPDLLSTAPSFASFVSVGREDELPASSSMLGSIGRRGWDMMRTFRPPIGGANGRKVLNTRPSDPRLGEHSRRRSFFAGVYPSRDQRPASSLQSWLDWLESPNTTHAQPRSSRIRALRSSSALSTSPSLQSVRQRREETTVFGAPLRTAVALTRIDPRLCDDDPRPPVLDRVSAQQQMLPRVMVRCIESLEKWGVEEEGLYRIPGRSLHTSRLRQMWDTPNAELHMVEISPADLDIHSVCSVLKMYLRELPDRLAPSDVCTEFDRVCSELLSMPVTRQRVPSSSSDEMVERRIPASPVLQVGDSSVDTAVEQLIPVMQRLSACSWYMLREISYHLGMLVEPENVARTKMTLPNLALVLAPTLQISVAMCTTLVQLRDSLFSDESRPLRDALDDISPESPTSAPAEIKSLGIVLPVAEVGSHEEVAEAGTEGHPTIPEDQNSAAGLTSDPATVPGEVKDTNEPAAEPVAEDFADASTQPAEEPAPEQSNAPGDSDLPMPAAPINTEVFNIDDSGLSSGDVSTDAIDAPQPAITTSYAAPAIVSSGQSSTSLPIAERFSTPHSVILRSDAARDEAP